MITLYFPFFLMLTNMLLLIWVTLIVFRKSLWGPNVWNMI